MTALMRGELIKAVTTRTLFGYAGLGVALVIANVLIVTQFSSELDHVSDKQEAIAGLPVLLLLLGSWAPPASIVTGRPPRRRWRQGATAGSCSWRAPAPTPRRASGWQR